MIAPDASRPTATTVYADRLAARRSEHARLEVLDRRFALARLGLFACVVAVALLAWLTDVSAWWLLAPVAAFVVLMSRHERVIVGRQVAARAIAHYERGLARLDGRWRGAGETGARFLDDEHPYAGDLDLFGPGSLFELLSTARTRDGEAVLAGWLLSGAPPGVIRARQQAVAELGPSVRLREGMAVAGSAGTHVLDADGLRQWAGAAALPGAGALRATTGIAAVALAAAAAVLAATGQQLPIQLVLAFQVAARYRERHDLERVLDAASGRARELEALAQLLSQLESASFSAARLVALQGMMATAAGAASDAIRELQRLSERQAWAHSMKLIPLALFIYGVTGPGWAMDLALVSVSAVLLFTPFVALAVVRWRRRHGAHVAGWIAAVAEFEALLALASYHFEHPDDPFPEVEDGRGRRAMFEGEGLGHPLLPAAQVVRNGVSLAATHLVVVSGSNMSGKSTLLRTVGINAVLALAGAPVRAGRLRISPLSIGATLRIQDSLQDGRSRFFAEITRLRRLSDLAAGPVPLLFLLDELLHGTNSHDRLAGATGIVRALLARGAIGLVTTHDLSLAGIAGELGPRAANIHFEDDFADGEMRFDYRVKPGPVTRSNALALMRTVGFDVGSSPGLAT